MRISELIIRFIDWFYRKPVAAILPRQTFRYVVCGGANVAFSWVCYFLVYNFVLDKEQLDLGFVVVSAYVATMLLIFPFTFFTGFWLNRYVTFRHSPLPTGTQLFRYLLSIGGSVVVNYVGLKFFVEFCGLWATPSQMLATFVTMIYSYLAKPFHLAELEARIRSLTLRQFTQQDVLLTCGDLTFDTRSRIAAVNGQTLTLTRKETGILEYLMVHQGRPVSQEELMDHVWDNSVDNFSNSIRVHISALRKKLRAALGYDPIRNRIGEGYLMGGTEE